MAKDIFDDMHGSVSIQQAARKGVPQCVRAMLPLRDVDFCQRKVTGHDVIDSGRRQHSIIILDTHEQ